MEEKATDKTLMRWGKYKGKPLGNIPAGYLIWLYEDWGLKQSGELHRWLREYIEDNRAALETEISDNQQTKLSNQ